MAQKTDIWTCLQCNRDFYRMVSDGMTVPKFCCADCREEYHKKLVKGKCLWCHKEFEKRPKYNGKPPKFCSMTCSGKHSGNSKRGTTFANRRKNMLEKKEQLKEIPVEFYIRNGVELVDRRGIYRWICATCSKPMEKIMTGGSKKPYFCGRSCRRPIRSIPKLFNEQQKKIREALHKEQTKPDEIKRVITPNSKDINNAQMIAHISSIEEILSSFLSKSMLCLRLISFGVIIQMICVTIRMYYN